MPTAKCGECNGEGKFATGSAQVPWRYCVPCKGTGEGTPKLEEISAKVYEAVTGDPASKLTDAELLGTIAAILRPFITPACSPPFDHMFANRFDENWTQEHENYLLDQIGARQHERDCKICKLATIQLKAMTEADQKTYDPIAELEYIAKEISGEDVALEDLTAQLEFAIQVLKEIKEYGATNGLTAADYIECCPTCASDDKVKQGRLIRNHKEVLCLDRWHLPDLSAPTSVPQAEPPKSIDAEPQPCWMTDVMCVERSKCNAYGCQYLAAQAEPKGETT